jgi:O-antigen/teichoic acid export membrane protein
MLPLINSNKPLISKFKNFPLGVRAGIWFAFLQYAQQAIIILATPIFTRIMPSEEYGLINVYNTWQSLLSIILTLKLSASIYQLQMVEYKDDKDNLTASLVTISNIILIIASVAFLLFGSFFSIVLTLPSEMLYIMMGDIWSQMIISFWLTRNKFEYKYQICLIVVLSNCFFRTISSIILVYMASNNQAVYKVLGNLIPELIYAVCILILIYRKGKKRFVVKYWYEAIKFNVVIVPSYSSDMLLSSSDRLMINGFCPRSDVALYSLAYSCAHLAQLFYAAINWVYTPYAYRKLEEKNYAELRSTANLITLLMAVLTGLLVAFAPEAIAVFAPSSYYEAIWVIPPAACGIFLTLIYSFFTNTEYFYKKNVFITTATIIGAAANILLNWLLIPVYGYLVASYTTVLGYLIITLLHYFFYNRIKPSFIYDVKTLVLITSALYLFSGVCLVLYRHLVIRYVIICLIILAIFFRRRQIKGIIKSMMRGQSLQPED